MKKRLTLSLVVVAMVAMPTNASARDRSKPPKTTGNPGDWFPQNSYPAEAKRNGQQGRVTVQLAIDNTGAPTACTVIGRSGSASLDKATCDLAMANGKFMPALDAKGQAVASTFLLPGVRWELHDAPPTKLEGPWRAAGKLMIDQAGKLASCTEQKAGPVPEEVKFCLAATLMPPEYGLYARGGSTAPTSELLMESSLSMDGAPALPMVYEQDGRETLQMAVTHFDVGADGKVSNCQVEAQSGPIGDLCKNPPGPYLPMDKVRHVTIKFAMSRAAAK